jgi:hypothetical protein
MVETVGIHQMMWLVMLESTKDEWEFDIVTHPGSHGARGVVVPQLHQENLAMLWYCVLPW